VDPALVAAYAAAAQASAHHNAMGIPQVAIPTAVPQAAKPSKYAFRAHGGKYLIAEGSISSDRLITRRIFA